MSPAGPLFADAGYWLALANSGDRFHERARVLSTTIRSPVLTTEPVLLEVGNSLARLRWRRLAVELLADVRADPDVEIISLTPVLFTQAVDLYTARQDKEWGLTDCVSFVVMTERGIREALAADQHFVQAGFRALLLEFRLSRLRIDRPAGPSLRALPAKTLGVNGGTQSDRPPTGHRSRALACRGSC